MADTTSREGTPQIYVPTLHRELLRYPVPGSVMFLDPGLPQTKGLSGYYRSDALPLPPDRAAPVLAELLDIGESLDLTTATGVQAARTHFDEGTMNETEKAALARFSSGTAHSGAEQDAYGKALVAAQKVLLLSWDLEERLVEIRCLHRQVADALKPLAENLRGTDADTPEEVPADPFLATLPENATDEVDWRLTVAAMAPFLPPSAILITAHQGMRQALLASCMLHPLPEDTADALENWPEAAKSALLWAKSPLWRVLGHAREPENAPWLLAAPEIIVCPGKGSSI